VDYRNPSQLRDGPVLVVGAANSGAEIALDVAGGGHRAWLAGRHPGHVPFRLEGATGRVLGPLVLRGLFHRVLTVRTPIGRKKRHGFMTTGRMLVRTKPKDLEAAGVERVGRVEEVRDGLPVLADGRTLEVANVVWCTGFRPGQADWIDLPIFGELEPAHRRGIVETQPGLYFVGLMFLYSASSEMFHGVGRDAAYVAEALASRVNGVQR
jgi:putative flavoprotein involved in K+ transport